MFSYVLHHTGNHHYYLRNYSCYPLFQVNQIRDSLAIMGDNSTAFSLPQVRNMCVFFLHIFQPFFQKKIQSMETLIKMAIFVHANLWLSLNVFAELCANTKLFVWLWLLPLSHAEACTKSLDFSACVSLKYSFSKVLEVLLFQSS